MNLNLVGLNGRQDEPGVLSVLQRSHGSEAALEEARAHYDYGDWPFIGWQNGDEILACAGAEKLDGIMIGSARLRSCPAGVTAVSLAPS
jgi:hypothetical protein